MNRLTKNNYCDDSLEIQNRKNELPEYKHNHYSQGQYNNDLWQYVKKIEDIEEELGIDLFTLFKALKQRYVYVKSWKSRIEQRTISSINLYNIIFYPASSRYIKDYGKTWALTKEELEDERTRI